MSARTRTRANTQAGDIDGTVFVNGFARAVRVDSRGPIARVVARMSPPTSNPHRMMKLSIVSDDIKNLPLDVIREISKFHPLLIPPFTNKTLRRAVKDYLAGGAKKQDIVKKYGEISGWDTSRVAPGPGPLSFKTAPDPPRMPAVVAGEAS